MSNNPRAFLDRRIKGGYQSPLEGLDKTIHDAWMKKTSWNLSRDDFIGLSYFHGDLSSGSDGSGPINGSEDNRYDVVYISEAGGALTRDAVSSWLTDYSSFKHGFLTAIETMPLWRIL